MTPTSCLCEPRIILLGLSTNFAACISLDVFYRIELSTLKSNFKTLIPSSYLNFFFMYPCGLGQLFLVYSRSKFIYEQVHGFKFG